MSSEEDMPNQEQEIVDKNEEIRLIKESQDQMRKNMVDMMQLLETMSKERRLQQNSDNSETNNVQAAQSSESVNQSNKIPTPPISLQNASSSSASNASAIMPQAQQNRRQHQVTLPAEGSNYNPAESTPLDERKNKAVGLWTSMLDGIGAQEERSESSDEEYEEYAGTKNRRRSLDTGRDKTSNRTSYLSNLGDKSQLRPRETIMYQAQPDYTHIELKALTIKTVHKFMREVATYQRKYNIELPVATLISHTVVKLLISASDWETLNESNFYTLQPKTLYRLMREYLQPTDQLTFMQKLDQNTNFYYEQDKPSPSNFQKFYESILLYKQSFLEIFEFLSQKNENNVPEISNRKNGVIKLFLDKIPEEFGQRLFTKIGIANFRSFQEFMQHFTDEVRQVYRIFMKDKEASMLFNSVKSEVARQNEYSTPSKNWRSNYDSRQTHSEPKRYQQHLNIEESTVNELSRNEVSEAEEAELPDEEGAELCVVTQDERVPNGCFKMITAGACSKSNCSYSHEASTLMKTIQYYEKKFQESKFYPKKTTSSSNSFGNNNNSGNTRPQFKEQMKTPAVLPRRPGPYTKSYQKIEEVEGNQDNERDSNFGLLQEVLLNTLTDSSMTSMHREGFVELPTADIRLERVLFDSGALHSDYISSSFVEEHRHLLEDRIYKSESTVRLGDNATTIKIKERVTLDVMFVDDSGKEHRATIKPCIFDTTGNELIIGLPSIASNFPQLFKEMLDEATKTFSGEDNLTTIAELKPPWTSKPEEIAPEDSETPLPCSFTSALHFMEMSFEEALEEYKSQLDEHVSKEFRDATKVVDLLIKKGHKVFVPQKWEGINGVPPLELRWKNTIPESMKPRARPINPRLFEHAKKEFDRLCEYLYVPSRGPHASCLVIAPKATKPFIRFCGDYVEMNKHQETGHYPIPNVQHELEKIRRFNIFLDIDMTNSFHQIKLAELTSNRLSVQTPWGQVRPLFMPEGIGPASGVLQSIVAEIFADFSDWSIVIFDNFLLLANTYEDAYEKLEIVIDRCIERNVYLKFAKTWLGFREVKFFGYLCKENKYGLTDERKNSIDQIPFPTKTKQMQSFLGSALFFKSFIPSYSDKAALLNDMVRKDFNWDPGTWGKDYKKAFENMKEAISSSFEIFYPNYDLTWILRTDASEVGVGAALFQVPADFEESQQLQPITFASKKFSDQAKKWATIEQEAYGIYFGVKMFSYYLHGKPFILETDHNNLLWIEASEVPKIMRWRVYLQSFVFLIRHISGKNNVIADCLSRSFPDLSYLYECEEIEEMECYNVEDKSEKEPDMKVKESQKVDMIIK